MPVVSKMPNNRFYLYLILLLANNSISVAQQLDLGSWNVLNVKYNYSTKISFFGEGQIRSLKLYDNFHYHELKGGLNANVYNNVITTIGLGSYQTYSEGGNFINPKNNNEFRIWPQVVFNQFISNLKIEQRYRLECRFTSNGYRNRFRYRLGLSYPFGAKKNDYKPYQIAINNEIFFTNNEPFF